MQIRLVFLSGSLAGTIGEVVDGGVTIGRNPDCAIQFDNSDGMVSSHHARIFARNDKVFIEDERSTNGTFVDGEPVKSSRLRPGQVITFGKNGPTARIEFDEGEDDVTWVVPPPGSPDTVSATAEPSTLTGLFDLARQRAAEEAGASPPQTAVFKAFVRLAQDRASRRFSRQLMVVGALALLAIVVVYGLGERKARELRGQLMAMSEHLDAQGAARTALEAQLAQLATSADQVRTAVDDLDLSVRQSEAEAETDRQAELARREAELAQREAVQQDRRFGPAVTERFAAGVGLIEFRIGWYNPQEGWLKLRGLADGKLQLTTTASDHPAFLASSQCTGFLIDDAGWVLTNRHCIDLQFSDPDMVSNLTLRMGRDGETAFTPTMTGWRISFPPGRVFDIDASSFRSSPAHDLALVRTTEAPATVPVLPLEPNPNVVAGEDVVLLAYPGGTELTARRRGVGSAVDQALADRIQRAIQGAVDGFVAQSGVKPVLDALPTDAAARAQRLEDNPVLRLLLGTLTTLADSAAFDELSRADQIHPDVNGNISVSGVRPSSISYHTLGGIGGSSGGPLIGAGLTVIGVNHASFSDNDRGAQYQQNEAVPVSYVWQFLPRNIGRVP